MFCQLQVILPLPLSLLSVQFSFFLFLSISLSFSPFLSFSALLALASSYFFFYLSFSVLNYTSWICSESFTAIFVFLSFSVYISISLLVLSLSVKLYSRREHSVQENYKCLRKGALEKFSTLLLDFFVCNDRIRMAAALFTAVLAMTGSGWQ